MIDCGQCGLAFPPRRPDGLYCEDDEHTCEDCGAINLIGLDDVHDDEVEAYVIGWRCKHGVRRDDECGQCAAEEGATSP